jgi:hypothetical protein
MRRLAKVGSPNGDSVHLLSEAQRFSALALSLVEEAQIQLTFELVRAHLLGELTA